MEHLDIIKRLCDNNFDTYIVGGGIRDILSGIEPEDFDVVTKATPDEVMKLFFDCNVKQVGKSFGVILVEGFEVATFRFDNYKDSECIVSFAETIHEDLSRRDLTINALAYCELTGEIIDNHGGRDDLKNRIIKFVGDPFKRIHEDPDRIIRACRFLAKIDGNFETETLRALKSAVRNHYIEDIAPERIRLEILKAMKTPKASKFFTALHEIGALKFILPSLDSCWNHDHGNHHVENVWEHCMFVGDAISTNDPILKLTGYLHDCGKPETFNPETKQFLRHEIAGKILTKTELDKLKFSSKEVERVSSLVRSHMYSTLKMSPKAIRRLLKKFNERNVNIEDFMRLRMADRKGNIDKDPFRLREYITMYKKFIDPVNIETPFSVHDLALSGGQIIKEFELKPGPQISKIQKLLLDYVIENGSEANNESVLRSYVNEVIN